MRGETGVRPVTLGRGYRMNSRGFSRQWQRIAVLGALFAGLATTAGGAELPTARPADVGLSAHDVQAQAMVD
jgi:hypothetical protein